MISHLNKQIIINENKQIITPLSSFVLEDEGLLDNTTLTIMFDINYVPNKLFDQCTQTNDEQNIN